MEKKYVLTDETIKTEDGIVLHRIRAVKDFDCVKAGDLGGFVESEENLDHDGECWIDGNAKAYGNAQVGDDTVIKDDEEVFG